MLQGRPALRHILFFEWAFDSIDWPNYWGLLFLGPLGHELLFLGLSATTLGDKTSTSSTTRKLDSAIYFTGHNMTRHRILNLTLRKTGEEYKKVKLRRKWVTRVENNTKEMQLAPGETTESMLEWCKTFRMSKEALDNAISNWTWRKNLNRDLNY